MATNLPFDKQIDAWVLKTENRIEGCLKESTQRVVQEANRSDDKGGRMRVDTGFLRNSLAGSIGSMPAGPSKGDDSKSYPEDYSQVSATISKWNIRTEVFYAGWTAAYARHRESKDAFLRMAVMQWNRITTEVTAEMKRRFK